MERSDEYELVKRVQAGDGEAFSELYEAHFEWVYKFLRVKVSDVHIAQELTQDVFMRAYESISQFRVDGSFGAWINGITQRVLLEHFRRKKNWDKHAPKFLNEYIHDGYPSLFQEVDAQLDNQELLERVLANLTDIQRKILIMRIGEEKTTGEVAKEIYGEDTPENRHKVSSNLLRAIQTAAESARLMR